MGMAQGHASLAATLLKALAGSARDVAAAVWHAAAAVLQTNVDGRPAADLFQLWMADVAESQAHLAKLETHSMASRHGHTTQPCSMQRLG